MKKTLFITFIVISLFASFLLSVVYGMITYQAIYLGETTINIDGASPALLESNPSMGLNENRNQFYQIIEDVANENNLELYRYSFDIYQNPLHPTTAIYTNAKPGGDLFDDIRLKSGSYSDQKGQFLSSIQTEDKNQAGVIEQFNGRNITEIHSFKDQNDLPMSFYCQVNSSDTQALDSFVNDLHEAGIQTDGEGNASGYMPSGNLSIFIDVAILFFCVYLLFIICFLYYITSRYKEFAVNKLFGQSNKRIVKHLLKDTLLLFGVGTLISFVLTTLGLLLYNRLSCYFSFLFLWVVIQLAIVAISMLLIAVLSYLLIKKINTNHMIKNKKPNKMNHILHYTTKFIFSIIAVTILIGGYQNMVYLVQSNQNMDQWQETADFAYIYNTGQLKIVDGQIDVKKQDEEAFAMKKLFELTNNQGGVLVAPSVNEYLIPPVSPEEIATQNSMPEYDPYRKSIKVNNHYLKRNPILDVDGNPVTFPDEYSQVIPILVPEKYQSYEQDILNLYTEDLTWRQYLQEDQYQHALKGTNSQNDPIPHDPLDVQIIYVKNDQSYFTYDPNCCRETNNAITDPIAIVKNNYSFNASDCLDSMAGGGYFAITEDMNHPRDSLEPLIKESGTESIVTIDSVYKQIDKNMYDLKSQIILQIAIMITSIAVLATIILTLASNYIEQKRQMLAVQKITGFSFIKRHIKYFVTVPIFWTIVAGVISVIGYSLFLTNPWPVWLSSFAIMMIDILLSLTIIHLKEKRSMKDTLKGG